MSLPDWLVERALDPEVVGELAPAEEAKVRAALDVVDRDIRAAVDRIVEDLTKRMVWLSDDTVPTLMDWYTVHQHHIKEPYIGCPFCQDRFVAAAAAKRYEIALERITHCTRMRLAERIAREALRR